MNYEKMVLSFLEYQRSLFHTEKTIQNYKEVLDVFNSFLCKNGYNVLCSTVFTDYQLYLSKKGLRSSSVASYLRHIKAFVHWLGENQYIEDIDLYRQIKFPKQPKKNVKIYSDSEIALIYQAITFTDSDWLRCRNILIVSLMLDSGLRQNEVCQIRVFDIDLKFNRLIVHGKGNKDRIVPLGDLVQKHILEYKQKCPYSQSEFFLFNRSGKPLTTNSIKLFITKLQGSLGFELSSHKLRHNFATNYLMDHYQKYGYFDTYSLMVLLGHEEISTTDRYLHLAKQFVAAQQRVSHLDKVFLRLEEK